MCQDGGKGIIFNLNVYGIYQRTSILKPKILVIQEYEIWYKAKCEFLLGFIMWVAGVIQHKHYACCRFVNDRFRVVCINIMF